MLSGWHDNQIAYLKGYGLADIETDRPFTVATPSAIGSISKTVTALAVLRLLGESGLDTTIGSHLPLAPPEWSDITVHQLLSHTAGFPRDPGDPEWEYPSTEEELREAFDDEVGDHPGAHPRHAYWSLRPFDPVSFDRGSSARYSNLGYALLGAIVDFETVSTVISDEVGYEGPRGGSGLHGCWRCAERWCGARDVRLVGWPHLQRERGLDAGERQDRGRVGARRLLRTRPRVTRRRSRGRTRCAGRSGSTTSDGGRGPGRSSSPGRRSRDDLDDIRHTAVSQWVALGADDLRVAEMAGHTSAAFTKKRYAHLFPGPRTSPGRAGGRPSKQPAQHVLPPGSAS